MVDFNKVANKFANDIDNQKSNKRGANASFFLSFKQKRRPLGLPF